MNDDELRDYRASLTNATLQFLVLVYALELHGFSCIAESGYAVALTPAGREVAEELFDTNEEFRNFAMEKVDLRKKDSFREDWKQNYLN